MHMPDGPKRTHTQQVVGNLKQYLHRQRELPPVNLQKDCIGVVALRGLHDLHVAREVEFHNIELEREIDSGRNYTMLAKSE